MDDDTRVCLIHFAKILDKIEARLEVIVFIINQGKYINKTEEAIKEQ